MNLLKIISLAILLSFCFISETMADSTFVESDVVYHVINNNTVNVSSQNSINRQNISLRDSILRIPASVKHSGITYKVKGIDIAF